MIWNDIGSNEWYKRVKICWYLGTRFPSILVLLKLRQCVSNLELMKQGCNYIYFSLFLRKTIHIAFIANSVDELKFYTILSLIAYRFALVIDQYLHIRLLSTTVSCRKVRPIYLNPSWQQQTLFSSVISSASTASPSMLFCNMICKRK